MNEFFAWAGGPPATPWALLGRVLAGLLLSAGVAAWGYRRESLSPSGVLGAVLVGACVFGMGGWVWGLLLIAFFGSSSALTHYQARQKQAVADRLAKTGRRDLAQTLANGAVPALLAAWYALTGSRHPLAFFACAGALAAVNADTWATELGVLSPQRPWLVTTRERVERGRSGAVSWLGLAASLAGAWLIGFLGFAFSLLQGWLSGTLPLHRLGWLPLVAAAGGVLGALTDSLLGATVQTTYYCLGCGKETEQAVHSCGRRPIHLRGWPWLSNDGVNLLASGVGALIAALLGAFALFL